MEEPIKKVGSHTLCIKNFVYDKNDALMYFTLEKEGSVTALSGQLGNQPEKRSFFTDETDFYFTCESKNGIAGIVAGRDKEPLLHKSPARMKTAM